MAKGPDIDTGCGNPREIRVMVETRRISIDGRPETPWRLEGFECQDPNDPTGIIEPEITAEMVVQEAWRAAPVTKVHVQPSEGWTLVNFPTNYYAETSARTKPVYLFG